jgi:hypothetical protein
MRIAMERKLDAGEREMQRRPGNISKRELIADQPLMPRQLLVGFAEQTQQRGLRPVDLLLRQADAGRGAAVKREQFGIALE